jgi:hypothetical protein
MNCGLILLMNPPSRLLCREKEKTFLPGDHADSDGEEGLITDV